MSSTFLSHPSCRKCTARKLRWAFSGYDFYMRKHLLVINFSMDASHSALSHQQEVVAKLSEHFQQVTVITGEAPTAPIPINVEVQSIKWQVGSPVRNGARLIFKFIRILIINRPNVVFSHMVPIHAAVTSPISRLFKVRHVLWYAHAVTPLSLRFANLFVNQILTSTPGSCNLTSRKVTPIGQGVDSKHFQFRNRNFKSLVDVLYVGRTDSSKNLPEIIDAVASAKLQFPKLQLSIVGGGQPLSENLNLPWVRVQGRAARSELPHFYGNADVFIHAFRGSLDKVLVEAALSGLPVITENDEFQKNFRVFGIRSAPISDQLVNLLNSDESVISEIVESNYQTALLKHELVGWISKIIVSLAPENPE